MRVDRGVRRRAMVLAALLAATTPASAALAATRPAAGLLPPSVRGLLDADPTLPRPEPVSDAARAAALAEPAIVLIDVRWEGYVQDRDTGDILDPEPVSVSIRCTGAGVGQDGYLLTTRSCLDPSAVTAEVFRQVVDRRVADGSVPAAAADDLLAELLERAQIGDDPAGDDHPERSVTVRRAVTDDEPMPASVVATADPIDGDAALLKIGRGNQPTLPLADDLALGTELVTIQCPPGPGSAVGVAATTTPPGGDQAGEEPLRPTFHTGTVTEISPRVLVEPSEPAEPIVGSSGGVVLTHEAAIAGLVDTRLATGELLVDLSVIRELLAEAEVDTELGQVDRDYRAGLDAYYEGRYGDAIARFDSVLAIIPSHLQAHEYRTEAQSLRDDQDDPPPNTGEVVDRVLRGRSWSLVGVMVLIAIVVFLVRRRRPDGAAPPAPPSDAPPGDASIPEEPAAEAPAAEAPPGRR